MNSIPRIQGKLYPNNKTYKKSGIPLKKNNTKPRISIQRNLKLPNNHIKYSLNKVRTINRDAFHPPYTQDQHIIARVPQNNML